MHEFHDRLPPLRDDVRRAVRPEHTGDIGRDYPDRREQVKPSPVGEFVGTHHAVDIVRVEPGLRRLHVGGLDHFCRRLKCRYVNGITRIQYGDGIHPLAHLTITPTEGGYMHLAEA